MWVSWKALNQNQSLETFHSAGPLLSLHFGEINFETLGRSPFFSFLAAHYIMPGHKFVRRAYYVIPRTAHVVFKKRRLLLRFMNSYYALFQSLLGNDNLVRGRGALNKKWRIAAREVQTPRRKKAHRHSAPGHVCNRPRVGVTRHTIVYISQELCWLFALK